MIMNGFFASALVSILLCAMPRVHSAGDYDVVAYVDAACRGASLGAADGNDGGTNCIVSINGASLFVDSLAEGCIITTYSDTTCTDMADVTFGQVTSACVAQGFTSWDVFCL